MMPDSYRTVRTEGYGEYEEKRSRFLAVVRPAATEAEAKALIEEMRASHPDARHHVYAYLAEFSAVQRMSDDGEPQGTGGVQLMEPMQRLGYTNLCLVVTRYFGGTLLGAGPLARAYGKAARLALENAGEAEYRRLSRFSLTLPYAEQKRIEAELKKQGAVLSSPQYGEAVTLFFTVRAEDREAVLRRVTDLTAGKCTPAYLGDTWGEAE